MKNYILLCFAFILNVYSLFAQPAYYEYSNPEMYKGYGIVFTEVGFPYKGQLIPFTPTEDEIRLADQIFIEQFNDAFQKYGWHHKNVKEAFWFYNRRYIGYYLDERREEKIIEFYLLPMKPKRKMKRRYDGVSKYWYNVSSTSPIFEEDMRGCFIVNLSKRKLSLF